MDRLSIRKADINDYENVVTIFKGVVAEMDRNSIPQWDEEYPTPEILKEDIINKEMFLGIIDGKVATVAVVNQQYDDAYNKVQWQYKDKSFAIIHRLVVNVEFQNHGVAKTMMKEIEDILKEQKIETVRLDAFSLNPYALKMYEKIGYVKRGEAVWRKGLFYLYEKKL